ncbi:DUF5082 family protein [Oceanobacillus longus]|uniref:DUF5082 family protein n=1 Tax=Oceanobacillus longus TaxID=930120 RepID=A0ABV8H0A6_9BACI
MSLFYYYGLLREKREQLQRLQDCQSKLQGYKQEFSSFIGPIMNPELSTFTWQGTLAKKFEEIRMEGMLHSYTDIENNQFNEVFSMLSNKMQHLRSEIQSIEQTIVRLKSVAE